MAKKSTKTESKNLAALKPDYRFWIQKQNWTLGEALFLLLDFEPRIFLDNNFAQNTEIPSCPEDKIKEFNELLEDGPFRFLRLGAPDELTPLYKKQKFERARANYDRPHREILTWAQKINISVPEGLLQAFEETEHDLKYDSSSPNVLDKQLRPSQADRIACQTLARKIWNENPDMTIAAMIQHPDILNYGNGLQYKGRETLRNWVKEVDPRSPEKKTGRPEKTSR